MIVLASRNGRIGLPAAIEALSRGGSAIDAVEAGSRVVDKGDIGPAHGHAAGSRAVVDWPGLSGC